MKKLNTSVLIIWCFAASFFVISSCDKMNDTQRKFAKKTETVYLGKVDSIRSYPGFGRVKLVWYISSDPRIDQTIIYWNMRHDSVIKAFNRTTTGPQKDSIIVDGLPEGTILFEFRNVNSEGESSLYSSAGAAVWGHELADGLYNRRLTGFDLDHGQSRYNLELSPAVPGDNVVFSQISYTDTRGKEKTVRIERSSNEVELDDFPDGGEFRFRTAFFLPQGIDTVYNEYKLFKAPAAVFERGIKMSFKGSTASKYFNHADSLYEWNAAGDLIIYALSANGSAVPTDTFSSIIPRSSFRDFFSYNGDKFIGVSVDDAVSMHQIVSGALKPVKTPKGANTFGTGFNYPKFIPARGFFFTVTTGSGYLRTWFAKDDATWDSPNGDTVGTGFIQYDPLILFNHQTLLGADAEGNLWSIPVLASGDLGPKRHIGSGWDRFKKMVSIGTQLLCMENNGDFYLFDDFNITDKFWIVNQ